MTSFCTGNDRGFVPPEGERQFRGILYYCLLAKEENVPSTLHSFSSLPDEEPTEISYLTVARLVILIQYMTMTLATVM